MHLPAALTCAFLACIAATIAEEPRPKRDLNYLKSLLAKLLGAPLAVPPLPISVEENIKYFPVPGLNDYVLKASPGQLVNNISAPIALGPRPDRFQDVLISRPEPPLMFRPRFPRPPLPMVRLPMPPPYLPIPLVPSLEPCPLIPAPVNLIPRPLEPIHLIPPPVVPLPLVPRPMVRAPMFLPSFVPSPPLGQIYPVPPPPLPMPASPLITPVPLPPAPPKPLVPVLPPLPKPIVPLLPPLPPVPVLPGLPRPILIPSFKYLYDQENKDGSITTFYSKDGRDVLVTTTDKALKIPPPVLVDRVEKVVTGVPFAPVVSTGPLPAPLPIERFPVRGFPAPIRPVFPPSRPPLPVEESWIPAVPPTFVSNRTNLEAIENPLSMPSSPYTFGGASSMNHPKSGYSFKLSNDEGYFQNGDGEKIFYSRLLPKPLFPTPLNTYITDDDARKPNVYTVTTEDKSVFDGVEEGSVRYHHETPHYGGPRLPWLIERDQSSPAYGNEFFRGQDGPVTVTRKTVAPTISSTASQSARDHYFNHVGPSYSTFENPPSHRFTQIGHALSGPVVNFETDFGQRFPHPKEVVQINKHEHTRPDGTTYVCFEDHHRGSVHPILPLEPAFVFGSKRSPNPPKTQSPNQVTNRGSHKYVNDSPDAKTGSTEAPRVDKSTLPPPSASKDSLSENPIVVLPSEQNFSYKVTRADGSSIDVTGNKDNKVSVKINNSQPSESRGDIPEALL